MLTIAIASDFLDALTRLPTAQQKKVREFTKKFQTNPTSAAINYEKIHSAKDPRVRTVRIDQKYRAVVLHPEKDNVYVLVWVDNHDEAMAWAENRLFEVNPVTGALQVINMTEAQEALPQLESGRRNTGLLQQFEDEVLLSFGVPSILLPAVRAVERPEELLLLARHLPDEAAEALIWLQEGLPLNEVREAVATRKPKISVDATDLGKALMHPDSRRRFVTIQSDDELQAILDAPLEKWRLFLHPSQERLVTKHFAGPAKVTGGAGTGKTVVAMHRARHLAKELCTNPEDKILFTTYTANLAQNVEQNLTNLCGKERERIEVVHLHAWAIRFMKKQGIEFRVATNDELDQYWEDAVLAAEEFDFDLGFLRQEWDQVVQAHDIQDLPTYLKVPRIGRGQTLSRPQRARVWKVFEHYNQALRQQGKSDWVTILRATRLFIQRTQPRLPYRAVIIDEAQDFQTEEWKLIRAIAPITANGLFLVGDASQRIYGAKIALRNLGIPVQGRSTQLKINYRTTEQIRLWAMAILQGLEIDDLDNEPFQAKGYKSLLSGQPPEILRCPSSEAEQQVLRQKLAELLATRRPEHICVVARTAKLLREVYQPMLRAAGIAHTVLDKGQEGQGIRLATMHRVKGLEFHVMILAGLNAGVLPLHLPKRVTDPVAKEEHDSRERSLLFVAATRARDILLLTCAGTPSPFIG